MSEKARDFVMKAKVITPERSTSNPMGYRYPIAEEYFGEGAKDHLDILVEEGLMVRDFHQRELGCPKCGSINLIIRFLCPKCGGTKIVKGEIIEHWPCGYVGTETEFKDGKCPKCKKKLGKIGVEHRKLGPMYKCSDCGEAFQTPTDRLNCANCEKDFPKEEAAEVILYAYRITPKLEEDLEAALYQKNHLVEKLVDMGFNIEPETGVYGKSGLKHEFYIVASQGKGKLKLKLVIDLLSAAQEVPANDVFQLQAKALDLEAHGIILVGIPKFSEEAKKLMTHYGIAYVETQTLQNSADATIQKIEELTQASDKILSTRDN
jgi:predicted RNA-binding Zn-ribbon protein involved in translation (DUF1610 family)